MSIMESADSTLRDGAERCRALEEEVRHLREALARSQREARESAARQHALAASLPDLILVLSRDGTYLDAQGGRPDLLYAPREAFLGRNTRDIMPPELARTTVLAIEQALATAEVQFLEYDLEVGGELRSFEARIVKSGADEVVAVVRDITSRRRVEEKQVKLQEAIRRSALEWRTTFDAIASPLLLLETDGRVVRMNEAARRLAHRPYEAAIQQPVAALGDVPPWPGVAGLVAEVARTSRVATTQGRDGRGRTWDMSVSPMVGPGGERWLVVVLLDITDLVKLQDSLRRSETMSAMGALVAGVSHEVRNPLFGISATLDAFEARFRDRSEYRRYFDVLQGEVKRLTELMQQLLDYGKPLRLELAAVSPREIVDLAVGACLHLARQSGVEIAPEIDPGIPPLVADRNRLVQVFQNLVENAVQHSARGGRIEVRVDRPERPRIRFTVADNGPGFQPGDLPRIFEPFFTRRRGGTGLGLSIVQRIVEQHGGEIEAANLPAGGAVMQVSFPIVQEGPA
jgi:PAS domain S-box-containing protein